MTARQVRWLVPGPDPAADVDARRRRRRARKVDVAARPRRRALPGTGHRARIVVVVRGHRRRDPPPACRGGRAPTPTRVHEIVLSTGDWARHRATAEGRRWICNGSSAPSRREADHHRPDRRRDRRPSFDAHKDQHVRPRPRRGSRRLAEEEDARSRARRSPEQGAHPRRRTSSVANSVAFWNACRGPSCWSPRTGDERGHAGSSRSGRRTGRGCTLSSATESSRSILPKMLDPETGEPIVTSRMVFVEVADDVNGADVARPEGDEDRDGRGAARSAARRRGLARVRSASRR